MALKKGSFRLMHRNRWRWCRANKIRRETLLVLLAIETGPWGAGHYTGVFHLGICDIADFTGLTDKEVDRAIDQLERIGAIVYDRRQQVVFVRGMLSRQSPSFAASENNIQGVFNHVERMPEGSRAVQEFIKAQVNEPELFELLEGYLEGEAEGEGKGTPKGTPKGTSKGTSNRPEDLRPVDLRPVDLDTRRPEDKDTAIANALAPSVGSSSSSTPKSTPGKSTAKASGKGKPGNGKPDALAMFMEKLSINQRLSIEGFWKTIKEGKDSRPRVRDELKRCGWFTEEEIRYIIPEKGSASDFLSVAN